MSESVKVGLVQINAAYSEQHYFPYSVGILQAYAESHLPDPGRFKFLLPIYRRLLVAEAVDQLRPADLAAFSMYVWNKQIQLTIARELKRVKPETLIVFGGPQVPKHDRPWEVEAFLRENPFVDLVVHGAGEKPFVSVLEHGLSGEWDKIPSVSFLATNPRYKNATAQTGLRLLPMANDLRQTERAPSFTELSDVPSPYTSGVFDSLMAANPKENWIGLWETDRNCPFSCTFCGWGVLEKKPVYWPLDQVFRVIDWFADRRIRFIFCANANFFLTERDLEIASYVVKTKLEKGFPDKLSVQDAKNRPELVFKGRVIMEKADLNTGVVISLQSVDPETLKFTRRDNIKSSAYEELQYRFREVGIPTMTDLILGLAGQTYRTFVDGVSHVIEHGQHNRIQFNICCSVPDAEMSHRDYITRHGLKLVTTQMVNIHGEVENEEVPEYQDQVIATAAMPEEDWVRALTFVWTVGLLHFDKVLQIPIVITRKFGGATYGEIIEFFSEGKFGSAEDFPILTRIREFFLEKARSIQRGGQLYVHSKEWLNVVWPADEYIFIELVAKGQLRAFYAETERALRRLVAEKGTSELPDSVLVDAIHLNFSLLKQPFQENDLTVELRHNIQEFYNGVLLGKEVSLEEVTFRYLIDRTSERWDNWNDWCRQVVWFGNKAGAYLYGNKPIEQLAGHY